MTDDETPTLTKTVTEFEYAVGGARVTATWLDPRYEENPKWRVTAHMRVDALQRLREKVARRLPSADVDKGRLSILCWDDNPDGLAATLLAAVRAHTTAVYEADNALANLLDPVLAHADEMSLAHSEAARKRPLF